MVKRTSQIKFRVTPLEKKVLERKASNAGLNTAEFCRSAAMGKEIGQRLTPDEVEAYKLLQKYHQNFVAIGNMFKKRDARLAADCQEVAQEIREHLKKFR